MIDERKAYEQGLYDGHFDSDNLNNEKVENLKQFLYEEIIHRRDYSASKSFEVVLEKIDEIFK